MTTTPHTSPPPPTHRAETTVLALRLAHSENTLPALTPGQIDAIVDHDGKTYVLHPAQEDLRRNEGRLQAVIESVADLILVANRGGAILSQNQSVSRLLGYEPEELVGSSIVKLIHEEDFSRFYSAFFSVIEGIRPDAVAEFRYRTRDGSYRMLEAILSKSRDVSVASVVLTCRDATPRPQGRAATPAEA